MDIRQLEHLVALVELGTVHAAAKDRFISQPGLSGSIKRLESQLGMALFERGGRGMEPNAKGKEFYKHAKHILEQVRLAKADLDTTLTKIVIGISESRPIDFIALLTDRLLSEFPNLTLSYIEGHTDVLSNHLLNGDVDIAFVTGILELASLPVEIRMLAHSSWAVFCRPNHPLTKAKDGITPRDLSKFGWIKNRTAPAYAPYLPTFTGERNDPQLAARYVTAANQQMAKELLLTTNLLGFGPRYSLREELGRGTIVVLDLPIEQNNTEIAAVKRRDVHSVVLDQALKIAESYFQEHKIT